MKNNYNCFVFSTTGIEEAIDKALLEESTIYVEEFYQLMIDAISYTLYTNDRVENYLYYWVFSENPAHRWRTGILPPNINEIAETIKRIIAVLRIDNPIIIDRLTECDSQYLFSVHNNLAVLRL